LSNTIIPGTRGTFAEFSVPEGTDFANAELQASDWTVTYHVGAQYKVSDRWWVGARYLHSAQLDLTGRAHFRQVATGLRLPPNNPFGLPAGTPVDLVLARLFQPGGVLAAQRLATSLTLPSQVVLGATYAISSAVEVMFDYQWTHWNVFDEAVLNFSIAPNDTLFLDFHDASTFRIAAQYDARSPVTARAGVSYNGHASPDLSVNPLLAEADRVSFSGGFGYRFTDRFSGDAGVELILQNDRRGSVRPRTSRQQTTADLNVGVFSGHAVFGGVTLSYHFGKRGEQPAADH
jgi:long-subunit fatty acid transport protein